MPGPGIRPTSVEQRRGWKTTASFPSDYPNPGSAGLVIHPIKGRLPGYALLPSQPHAVFCIQTGCSTFSGERP